MYICSFIFNKFDNWLKILTIDLMSQQKIEYNFLHKIEFGVELNFWIKSQTKMLICLVSGNPHTLFRILGVEIISRVKKRENTLEEVLKWGKVIFFNLSCLLTLENKHDR
jgi:hypothetical protein